VLSAMTELPEIKIMITPQIRATILEINNWVTVYKSLTA